MLSKCYYFRFSRYLWIHQSWKKEEVDGLATSKCQFIPKFYREHIGDTSKIKSS